MLFTLKRMLDSADFGAPEAELSRKTLSGVHQSILRRLESFTKG